VLADDDVHQHFLYQIGGTEIRVAVAQTPVFPGRRFHNDQGGVVPFQRAIRFGTLCWNEVGLDGQAFDGYFDVGKPRPNASMNLPRSHTTSRIVFSATVLRMSHRSPCPRTSALPNCSA